MSESPAQRWNKRYANKIEAGSPCWVLANHLHLLPASGKSLDLACGLGANALCLSEQGLTSHGWDVSSTALAKLKIFAGQRNLTINCQQRDVEQQPPPPASFDVIVVSQFLYRPLFETLMAALTPGGLLFYQTFNQAKLSERGPSNANFLLAPGELLERLKSLELLFYREDGRQGDLSQGLRNCSYYIGRKPI